MTRTRTYGQDLSFMKWMRENPRLDSRADRLAPTDIDLIVHQYRDRTEANPKLRIDNMMLVEIKTRTTGPAKLRISQADTYAVLNAWFSAMSIGGTNGRRFVRTCRLRVNGEDRRLRVWGSHVISMSGDRPENSVGLWWDDRDEPVSEGTLEQLLNFKISPFTFRSIDYRDHHANEQGRWPLLIGLEQTVAP
jgi:hypothetical protein